MDCIIIHNDEYLYKNRTGTCNVLVWYPNMWDRNTQNPVISYGGSNVL